VVKKRRAIEHKRTFQERISHYLNPYRVLTMMGKLEVALWNRNKSTFKYGAISLHNCCFFLYTKQSLSRGESGVNADLSELVDFEIEATFISWSSKNAIQIAPPHTTCPATVTRQTAEV
jgi:hypothetical protein